MDEAEMSKQFIEMTDPIDREIDAEKTANFKPDTRPVPEGLEQKTRLPLGHAAFMGDFSVPIKQSTQENDG